MSDDRPTGDGEQPTYPQYPGQYPGWSQPPQQGPYAGPYGQPYTTPQGPPPGYGYAPGWAQPKHPSATTALVLGIIAVAGGMLCYLPALVGPFAWWTGQKAVREIDASLGQLGGRGEAKAGLVLGVIGTVLALLLLAGIALLVVLTITVEGFWAGSFDSVLAPLRGA